ncbi:CDP-diacylglycerol diphosphatase [Rhodococcus erythropolis]|uniref:CDP-diacylglycerol diphosphatase n=1 Tax=Rhodococcus erythropolis TaxID=1833 RepID=UPI00294A64FE|nr:CDP-diacylglycerol diphosphatase [Rhodococcus erythropolis]MDV6278679.1 CDP-diacylglycerol diphosphatase [Rhodococcus erythropolis]
MAVIWPNNDQKLGYAMHNGAKGGAPNNFLLIPTVRIKGIECPNLLDPSTPEYFNLAYRNLHYLPSGTDWALSIESANNRNYNQLHIHVSRLSKGARRDIDKAVVANQVAPNQGQWLNSVIAVQNRGFRAWNADAMTHSFFGNLNEHVVEKIKGITMGDQTILITANKQGSGFIVLSSDKKSNLNPYGVDNTEFLLNK